MARTMPAARQSTLVLRGMHVPLVRFETGSASLWKREKPLRNDIAEDDVFVELLVKLLNIQALSEKARTASKESIANLEIII